MSDAHECEDCGRTFLTSEALRGHRGVCEERPGVENPAQPGVWNPSGHGRHMTPARTGGGRA